MRPNALSPCSSFLRRGITLAACIGSLAACNPNTSNEPPATSDTASQQTSATAIATPTATTTPTAPATKLAAPGSGLPPLSPSIPLQIPPPKSGSLEDVQHAFDVFSWQMFVALNWPANADGSPNTNLTIGQNPQGPVVWQSWRESRGIFLPGGAKPAPWGTADSLPKECAGIQNVPANALLLTQVGKTPNVLDESGEPFQTGPLIDQNGQYTRYEILTNEQMFNYILDNNLYSQSGQASFNQDANFPMSTPKTNTLGAIMIKAAWVKMGGKFDPANYHTAYALVYDNPDEQHGVKPACSLEQVGLVGFHIAHKTDAEPQWIWSTFEHVANVPTQNEKPSRSAYNFFDPSCSDCAVNQPPARPWNPATPFTQPSQIERVIAITEDTKQLNASFHEALVAAVPDSVWTNYELISTQWPTDATNPTDPTGVPAPSFLANTTLETYIQGDVKQTSSSCMACHNNATDTNGQFSDFTYLLQRAQ